MDQRCPHIPLTGSPASRLWLRPVRGGLQVTIRLTPKAARDELVGVEDDADGRAYLKARVRAVPEKGKANAALIALLAKRCRMVKSRMQIISGETSRLKVLMIDGEAEALVEVMMEISA